MPRSHILIKSFKSLEMKEAREKSPSQGAGGSLCFCWWDKNRNNLVISAGHSEQYFAKLTDEILRAAKRACNNECRGV